MRIKKTALDGEGGQQQEQKDEADNITNALSGNFLKKLWCCQVMGLIM